MPDNDTTKRTIQDTLRVAWEWADDAGWPVVLLFIFAASAVILPILFVSLPSEEDRARGAAARQKKAEAWLVANHLDGAATCFTWTSECDVVPKDARAPFRIDCMSDLPCSVVHR